MLFALVRAIAVTAVAVTWLAGCPACPDTITYFAEDFELCDGQCDWALSGEGTADLVETVHPGEHALLIEGATTATLQTPGASFDVNYYGEEPLIELVTNCTGPLYIDVTYGASGYAIQLTLPTGSQYVWGGDYEVVTRPLPQVFTNFGAQQLESVSIRNVGGTCVVDQIRLYQPGGC